MSESAASDAALNRLREAVPSCTLDARGLRDQRARHRILAPSVDRADRQPDRLVVEFAPGYDEEALREMIAVERECCPFFAFDFDAARRRLEVAVQEPDKRPALDAIASALLGG